MRMRFMQSKKRCPLETVMHINDLTCKTAMLLNIFLMLYCNIQCEMLVLGSHPLILLDLQFLYLHTGEGSINTTQIVSMIQTKPVFESWITILDHLALRSHEQRDRSIMWIWPFVWSFSSAIWAPSSENVSSGVSDQVTFKPACSATETS